MRRIKMLSVIPNKNDTTSWHRGSVPLSYLSKHEMPNLEVITQKEVTLADTHDFDIAFLQRPFNPQDHLPLVKLLKHANVPIICDWDDDLFTVPKWNKSSALYSQDAIKQAVATIASLADVVTVSTPELVRVMGKFNKNVVLIPNAVNNYFEPPREEKEPNKIIMWRGSDTHMKDLMDYSEAIKKAASEHPDWVFLFWGYNPEWLTETEDNCLFEGGVDIKSFYTKYLQISPAATIVPLHDCQFNYSKSCTAWQQAVYANGVAIVPDWEEWRRPGSLLYTDQDSFYKHLKDVIEGMVDVTKMSNEGWKYIQQNMTLEKTNKMRAKVIKDLLKGKF